MAGSSRSSLWYLGSFVAIVVIGGGSWFGYTSGQLAEASRLHEETEQAAHQNTLIQARIQALQRDFAKLDEYKAEIDNLRVGIPAEVRISEFLRELATVAETHSVTIINVETNAPTTLVPTPPPPPEGETSQDDAEGSEAAEEGSTESQPSPPDEEAGGEAQEAVIEGFAAVPIQINAVGDAEDVSKFIESLQTGLERLFLVVGFREMRLDPVGATGGLPEIVEGMTQLELDGLIYVLEDALHAGQEPETSQDVELPTPKDRNPFIPIEGVDAPSGGDVQGEG